LCGIEVADVQELGIGGVGAGVIDGAEADAVIGADAGNARPTAVFMVSMRVR